MFCLEALGEKSAATHSCYNIVFRGDGPYTVGRHESNAIVISSPEVSRNHASLEIISFREFLNQCPGAYDNYYGSERAAQRREFLEYRQQRIEARHRAAMHRAQAAEEEAYAREGGQEPITYVDEMGNIVQPSRAYTTHGHDNEEEIENTLDPLEELEAQAFEEEEESLMLSLVLCVRHFSKSGSTEIRVSRPLEDLITAGEARAAEERQRMSELAREVAGDNEVDAKFHTRARTATLGPPPSSSGGGDEERGMYGKTPNEKLAEGPLILHVSSVAYIPSRTDDAYAISFGSKAHFKITYRPVIVAISQLHFSSEYVREMALMYRQLGCTVLSDGNPTPNLEESSFQREFITHVGLVGAVTVDELEEERRLAMRSSGNNSRSPSAPRGGNANSLTPNAARDANSGNRGLTITGPRTNAIVRPFTCHTRQNFFYNPLAKIHVCEEIDDSVSVLNALTIGYMLALPVYIFELFAIIAADASRPLHQLPHPSKSIGGACAEPQQKRDVYGSAVYCYPDSVTCPFSLYPIPQNSTLNRSRVRLFANRKFFLPNPVSARRNQMALAMGGCSRPLFTGTEELPPTNTAVMTAERLLKHQIEEKVTGAQTQQGAAAASAPYPPLAASSSFSPLTAGSYVVVTSQMEFAVRELFTVAQAHYANYHRYPMAVLMSHPYVIHESQIAAADPVVFEELRVIAAAVHRGYIPITERCLHAALLTNKFIPVVVDEFVAWCVDEQRQVGLHIKGGATAGAPDDAHFDAIEAQQRRDLLIVMFGEMLANDPQQVEHLLQKHNDSLFQQLSADKASRYAAVEDAVLRAGPSNLGGGLLRHNQTVAEASGGAALFDSSPAKYQRGGAAAEGEDEDDPAALLEASNHINRRSLPLPQTEFPLPHHEKKKPKNTAAATHVDPQHNSMNATAGVTGALDRDAGGDGGDFDSDATPSDLDSEDHELNKVRVKGYHTTNLTLVDDRAHFNRTISDAMDASAKKLRPEMGKIVALFRQVEKNNVLLASGGPDAHPSNSMLYNHTSKSISIMSSLSVVSGRSQTHSTSGARRPSQNFPLARTTVTGHTIAYLRVLLDQHIKPQLERLEACALTKESRGDHGAVQQLWDEADSLRSMCEVILENHEREVSRLEEKKHQSAVRGDNKLLGYTASELAAESQYGDDGDRSVRNHARNTNSQSPQRNPHLRHSIAGAHTKTSGESTTVKRAGSPQRIVGGVNATFLRSNSSKRTYAGSPARSGAAVTSSSSTTVSRGPTASLQVYPSVQNKSNQKSSGTPLRISRAGTPVGGVRTTTINNNSVMSNFPFTQPAAARRDAGPPAPYHHHSRLDETYVNNISSLSSSGNPSLLLAGGGPHESTAGYAADNITGGSNSMMTYDGNEQSSYGYDNITTRTRDALSFDASARNTTTPTRRTQTNMNTRLKDSAEQRNSRYAPFPLFAAQKVHRSQALQATTARVQIAGGHFFTDSDPTKIHLTGEERVDATLQEPIASYDTSGVARRRQLFAYRYGPEEGNKRFTLWLNSQTTKWTREFHRTIEMKGLRFSDLMDAKHAW